LTKRFPVAMGPPRDWSASSRSLGFAGLTSLMTSFWIISKANLVWSQASANHWPIAGTNPY
jgi:hypothetical protein